MCVLFVTSCGTKKNTAVSRNWQAFTTRYNVYFNGKEHYIEQLQQMERDYEDDYSRRLLTHPAEARADQKMPQPSGDFKRTIEKMQKAIQLHSIKKSTAVLRNLPKEAHPPRRKRSGHAMSSIRSCITHGSQWGKDNISTVISPEPQQRSCISPSISHGCLP